MKTHIVFITIFASTLFISCISTVGPEGPSGANAEIYSSTIEIVSDLDFVVEDEFVSVASYGWDGVLDEATVDEGLVIGYLRFEGTTPWHSIPFNIPLENDLVTLSYSFDINNFDLILEGEVGDNNEANEEFFDGDILRIVAIPPSALFKGKGFDYTDYEAVVKAYNLTFAD